LFFSFKISFSFFNLSVKSDTKWLSWFAYQAHIIVSKNRMDDCMDLETFKNGFYFKVVCIFKKNKNFDVTYILFLFEA
jgi:hypothetical protein